MSETMEDRLREAARYLGENPSGKVSAVARDFRVSSTTLRRRLAGIKPLKGRPSTKTKLSRPQEAAICRYIDWLEDAYITVTHKDVADAANAILRERLGRSKFAPVGPTWASRFLRRYNYNLARHDELYTNFHDEEEIPRVQRYFCQLQKVISDNGIFPSDIWSMDEAGFYIGAGKDKLVYTRLERSQYLGVPENKESATAIECISAAGRHLPAFVVLPGQRHEVTLFGSDAVVSFTESGDTHDEISLEWLQHFCNHADKSRAGSKRLLILDAHGYHLTRDFISTCYANDIIPFGLAPQLKHLLQPLDVVIFQPLEQYYAMAVEMSARDGVGDLTRLGFLALIAGIREDALQESTIQQAFEKTGIHPLNPEPIVEALRQPLAAPPPRPFSPTREARGHPAGMPLTIPEINEVYGRLQTALQNPREKGEEARQAFRQLADGVMSAAAENFLLRRELGLERMAETAERQESP